MQVRRRAAPVRSSGFREQSHGAELPFATTVDGQHLTSTAAIESDSDAGLVG